ncbi:MAG: dTDP-4-dehydrorhamnose 3,5-epimerase [Gemmatimonadaceae bacterium]|nr:dTDP-4-dehydrorhamnose 3,5-epimerase [Gemmatimonadaceae bacterium]
MEFVPTRLPEVLLIKPRVFRDDRGYFMETWHEQRFAGAGVDVRFVQDNHSHSIRNALRGLHYQIRHAQGKLVRVVQGAAYDVAVDLRRSSPRFGQWVGVELTAENHHMLWVPAGFGHGYLAMSDTVDFLYKCTDVYAPQFERAVRWDDAAIGIKWPLPPGTAPLLSAKDQAAPLLDSAEVYL